MEDSSFMASKILPHVLHMQPECAIFVKSSCVSSSDLPLQMYLMHLSKKIIFKILRMIRNVYSKFHFLTKLYFFLSISISLLGRCCLLSMTPQELLSSHRCLKTQRVFHVTPIFFLCHYCPLYTLTLQ